MCDRMFRVGLVAALMTLAAPALAQLENGPKKAKKMTMELVRGYEPCVAPNDAVPPFLFEACTPPVPSDTVCDGFTEKGFGKYSLTLTGEGATADLRAKVVAKGLRPGCEGETLCFGASTRVTTLDCQSGAPEGCTQADLVDLRFGTPDGTGCCVVTNGKCKISGSTVVDRGPLSAPTSAEIQGCSLNRIVLGVGTVAVPFRCGFFLP